ncbi:MAG: hypothetical protein WC459_01025 [Patescibacteria group bacterium]
MFIVCLIVPGGLFIYGGWLLLEQLASRSLAMLAFVAVTLAGGCAGVQYQDAAGNVRISGVTTAPEAAMIASAEAEAVRAQAYAVRKCADSNQNCGALWGPWGGYGALMDTTGGVVWGWMGQAPNQAQNTTSKPPQASKDLEKLKENDKELAGAFRELNKKIIKLQKGN